MSNDIEIIVKGVDGSGKSTIAELIHRSLHAAGLSSENEDQEDTLASKLEHHTSKLHAISSRKPKIKIKTVQTQRGII